LIRKAFELETSSTNSPVQWRENVFLVGKFGGGSGNTKYLYFGSKLPSVCSN